MTTVALLVALLLPPAPQAPPPDRWIALDKWKHFAATAVIQSVGYGAALGHNGHAASLRTGAASAAVIGLAKELYDWRRKGVFSVKDLVWDALGAGVAAIALHAAR